MFLLQLLLFVMPHCCLGLVEFEICRYVIKVRALVVGHSVMNFLISRTHQRTRINHYNNLHLKSKPKNLRLLYYKVDCALSQLCRWPKEPNYF